MTIETADLIAKIVHENGPVVIDAMGEGLAWRPLDYGTWTPIAAIPTPPPADHSDLIARLDKVYNALTPGAIDIADLDGMAFTVADAMSALQAHASPRELRLEAALRPFAQYKHPYLNDPGVEDEYEPGNTAHSLGDYRRARTALELG